MPGFADDNDSLFNAATLRYAKRGFFQCGFTYPHLPSYLCRVVVILVSERFRYSLCTDLTSVHAGRLPVRTPVAIFGSVGVCIYVPTSRHWLISYSRIHLT